MWLIGCLKKANSKTYTVYESVNHPGLNSFAHCFTMS